MFKLFSDIKPLQSSERFYKSFENKKKHHLKGLENGNRWKSSWSGYPCYFSKIPELNSGKTAWFLKMRRKKTKKEKLENKFLKLNKILTNIFYSNYENKNKTKWIYLVNKYLKKNAFSWDLVFESFYTNKKKMDDKLWLNASISRNIESSLSHREKYINKKKQDIEKITRRNRSYSLPDIYPRNIEIPLVKIEKKNINYKEI